MKIICIDGGLGNQMFQYAFRLNHAEPKEEVLLDVLKIRHSSPHNGYELQRIFNINEKEISRLKKLRFIGPFFYYKDRDINFFRLVIWFIKKTQKKYNFSFNQYIDDNRVSLENNFYYKYTDLLLDKKSAYFYGTFQSYKYFKNIKDKVKRVFTFPQIMKDDTKNFKILEIKKTSKLISVHVRRGDYLSNQYEYLNICDLNYYKKAFSYLEDKLLNGKKEERDKIKILVFSDDIKWCKNNFNFLKDFNVVYIDWNKGKSSYKDMQLMSECNYNIISNSTFSWWGAYLNNYDDKIVIAPKYWLRGVKTTGDRVPEDWLLV